MKELKIKKASHPKENFREKVAELAEEMWEKIGRHHHGLYGTPDHLLPPDADMSESDNILSIKLELPGIDEDDVEVEIDTGKLTVHGEKRNQREESGENYFFRERRFGKFERSFMLPDKVDQKKVKAILDKGVLTVRIPFNASTKKISKKIKVN